MKTQAEVAAALQLATQRLADVGNGIADIKAKVTKIGTETDGLQAKIKALEDAINSGGEASPEVEAALVALNDQCQAVTDAVSATKTVVQTVDDKVPDEPPPTA